MKIWCRNRVGKININMRCIEMYCGYIWHFGSSKININMRCIEIGEFKLTLCADDD